MDLPEQRSQASHHLRGSLDPFGRPHQQVDRSEMLLLQAERLPDAAFQGIALQRRAVPPRDQDPEPRPSGRAPLDEEGVPVSAQAPSLSQQPLEIRLAAQPPRRAQPEAPSARRGSDYSASRRRPRARRLRSTLRPPAVRLRTRKPWRRARRVLEGWYVRLVAICRSEKGRY